MKTTTRKDNNAVKNDNVDLKNYVLNNGSTYHICNLKYKRLTVTYKKIIIEILSHKDKRWNYVHVYSLKPYKRYFGDGTLAVKGEECDVINLSKQAYNRLMLKHFNDLTA